MSTLQKRRGRRSVLDEVGDIHASKGSRSWCIAVVGETKKTLSVLENGATSARDRLRALKAVEAWKPLGLVGWSALLATINLSEDDAERLMQAKRGRTIADIVPLAKRGRPPKGQEGKVANGHLKSANKTGGNSQERILRRLARDNPDILDQLPILFR